MTTLILRRQRRIGPTFKFDATLSEVPTFRASVTANPVELGANVNDHVIQEPTSYTITGFISNDTLTIFGNLINTFAVLSGQSTRVDNAIQELIDIKEAGDPIQVVAGKRVLNNMILTSIRIPEDTTTVNAAQCELELEEVILVNTETVVNDPDDKLEGQTRTSGSSVQSEGRKIPTQEKDESILLKMSKKVGFSE